MSRFRRRPEAATSGVRRLLPIVLLALVACARSPDVTAVAEVEGAMPRLAGRTLAGGALSPGEYAGRVVVVNFWATWCGPCRREQPILSAAQSRAGGDGPFFVGVNYRDDAAAARAYLDEFGVAYPSLEDAAGDLAFRFGVPFLPTTLVVDGEGRLRFRVTGEIDAATLEDLVERASEP